MKIVKAKPTQLNEDVARIFALLGPISDYYMIAGSYALWLYLHQPKEWAPNDIDLFVHCPMQNQDLSSYISGFPFLYSIKNPRLLPNGILEEQPSSPEKKLFVHNTKYKTPPSVNIDTLNIICGGKAQSVTQKSFNLAGTFLSATEVLMNFDLVCSRIGFYPKRGEFILTDYATKAIENKVYAFDIHRTILVSMLKKRIQKYEGYGFFLTEKAQERLGKAEQTYGHLTAENSTFGSG